VILKICGITNQEDADAAVRAGANAIGFNFYPRSPRYVAPEQAARIVTVAGIRRVGVVVNEQASRVEQVARAAALDLAQLHGDEAPAEYPAAIAVWKAARVTAEFEIAQYNGLPAEALVLDGPAGGLYGGAGVPFDWTAIGRTTRHIILAGGLDGSNVARAILLARPWGVDACSRIESVPGRKDHRKMSEFLEAAMAALAA
jgi:phosphoribosylanthranilate isomerase